MNRQTLIFTLSHAFLYDGQVFIRAMMTTETIFFQLIFFLIQKNKKVQIKNLYPFHPVIIYKHFPKILAPTKSMNCCRIPGTHREHLVLSMGIAGTGVEPKWMKPFKFAELKLCTFMSWSWHAKRHAEAQQLFVCQYGHKMVYKGSTSNPNGMNKMIYLVCSSRIFDMLGYI